MCLCQERLTAAGLSFLSDESDTVLAYENKGKNNEETRRGHDPLMSALDNLNRVQQLEIIHGTTTAPEDAASVTTVCHVTHGRKRFWLLSRPDVCLFVSGYNDMKSELKDFLQRFAAEGKVS